MNLTAGLARTTLASLSRPAPRTAARLAHRLFRTPVGRSRLRPAEEPLMRQATTGTLHVAGADVDTFAWGDGRSPVLILHGWQSRASRFAPLVTALLAAGHSPVAFDAPGHGGSGGSTSTAFDYRDLAWRLHQRHGRFSAVVGHSLGGLAAFFTLRQHDIADRLVAIAAPADFDHVLDGFCAQLAIGPRVRTELRRRLERAFPGETDLWSRLDTTRRPEQLTLPMLVVHDDTDDVIAPSQARRIAAAYEHQADLLVTQGLGHRRVIADPAVIDAVLDFMAVTEPAAVAAPATTDRRQGVSAKPAGA
ncbi:alpha/beta hydrolase [Streptomyces sp. 4N509B]|uniref:alpha/beta hydrolase n=1 Tax=Streptomyces sp. 4N509B TaxID=3457413 RepID=UPI003FD05DEC